MYYAMITRINGQFNFLDIKNYSLDIKYLKKILKLTYSLINIIFEDKIRLIKCC